MANDIKFIVFVLFSWNLVKMIISWGDPFHEDKTKKCVIYKWSIFEGIWVFSSDFTWNIFAKVNILPNSFYSEITLRGRSQITSWIFHFFLLAIDLWLRFSNDFIYHLPNIYSCDKKDASPYQISTTKIGLHWAMKIWFKSNETLFIKCKTNG